MMFELYQLVGEAGFSEWAGGMWDSSLFSMGLWSFNYFQKTAVNCYGRFSGFSQLWQDGVKK
ncbi:MAG: hypothetical protein JF609_09125 [Verrucomicrobia bacterium]|nr:hypothetical protein [Verrucomicrobiota bacterium]